VRTYTEAFFTYGFPLMISPVTNHEVPRHGKSIKREKEQNLTDTKTMTDSLTDTLLDGGYLPHALVRVGIRRQLADRLRTVASPSLEAAYERKARYLELLRTRPIAVETDAANEQHYEVATGVHAAYLGPRMKYSSCLYPTGGESLADAEEAMLRCYVERAGIEDGMRILDLG